MLANKNIAHCSLLISLLFIGCQNPWLADMADEFHSGNNNPLFSLTLTAGGLTREAGDTVSFSDSADLDKTTAFHGDTVTIYYNLESTALTDMLILSFGASSQPVIIEPPLHPHKGSVNYSVNKAHGTGGSIAITAEFIHSNLTKLDPPTGVGFDKDGEITFTPDSNPADADESFIFTLYKDGNAVSGFTDIPVTPGSTPPGIVEEMLKSPGVYMVGVKARPSNFENYAPSTESTSPAVYVHSVTVTVIGNIGSERVVIAVLGGARSHSVSPLIVNVFRGTNLELTANPTGGSRFVVWSGDGTGAANDLTRAINNITVNATVTAEFTAPPLAPPANVNFNQDGEITFAKSPDDDGTIVINYIFTLYKDNNPVTGFTAVPIISGNTPSGIVEKMLESAGAYTVKVRARPADLLNYGLSPEVVSSTTVYVHSVTVTVNGNTGSEKVEIAVLGGARSNFVSPLIVNVFRGTNLELTANPEGFRFVTWSGSGTGGTNTLTRNITVMANATVTAAFADPSITISSVGAFTAATGGSTLSMPLSQSGYSGFLRATVNLSPNTGTPSYQWYSTNSTAVPPTGGTTVGTASANNYIAIPGGLTEGTYYYFVEASSPNAPTVRSSSVVTVTVVNTCMTCGQPLGTNHLIVTSDATFASAITSVPNGGTICVQSNFTNTSQKNFNRAGVTAYLRGSGTITGTANVSTINVQNGTFIIDSTQLILSAGGGVVGGNYFGIVNVTGGTFEFLNGTIRNATFGVLMTGGTFNMRGGTISNNVAPGVYMMYGGKFNMYGGSISNNNSGGLYVDSTSSLGYGRFFKPSSGTGVIQGNNSYQVTSRTDNMSGIIRTTAVGATVQIQIHTNATGGDSNGTIVGLP